MLIPNMVCLDGIMFEHARIFLEVPPGQDRDEAKKRARALERIMISQLRAVQTPERPLIRQGWVR